MPNRTLTALLSAVLAIFSSIAEAREVVPKSCAYDRARLLALSEQQFDQDMAGGWRALSSIPGCTLVAADLLRDYRELHQKNSGLLFWHEAQVRANAGQYSKAIALMKKAYKPAKEDRAGWNPYVEATIAFLRRDKAGLKQARLALAGVQPPAGPGIPPVIDGYMEVEFSDGSKKKVRWPLNIDVVEGLENCFNKSYAEAYSVGCQPSKPTDSK